VDESRGSGCDGIAAAAGPGSAGRLRVVAKTGAQATREFMRVFMVPGMGHGVGKTGAKNFYVDTLAVIERWKQSGQAPNQLVVSHYKDGKEVGQRLVCQYPQIAFYKGTGNPEAAASFECR